MPLSKRCKKLLCMLYVALLPVTGVLLIIYSIYLGYKLMYYFRLVPSDSIAPFILILLLALGHIVLTWFGAKGVLREYTFYICLFIAISVVLIVSEIAVAVWVLVLKGKLNGKIEELMRSSFEDLLKSSFKSDKLDWIRLQSQFECCGINNVTDYTLVGSIPFSCCAASTYCTTIYQKGCKEDLVQYSKQLLLHLGLTGFGSALFQILGVIAFIYFYKTVKQQATEAAKRREEILQEINPLSRQPSAKSRNSSVRKPKPISPSVP